MKLLMFFLGLLSLVSSARADQTVTVVGSEIVISDVQIDETYSLQTGPSTIGGERLQALFRIGDEWFYLGLITGMPCSCRPGGLVHCYALDSYETGPVIGPPLSTSVDVSGNVWTIRTEQPLFSYSADFNGDGLVTIQDLLSFLDAYFEQRIEADYNRSTSISPDDIYAYLSLFFS